MKKMTIQKTCTAVIDIEKERKRINEAFSDRPQTRNHLNKLMDFIEAQAWDKAYKELESKWWEGRDAKLECPRLEFVGLLDFLENEGFDHLTGYADLVWAFARMPHRYKVLETA